jgi:hypothetical protein
MNAKLVGALIVAISFTSLATVIPADAQEPPQPSKQHEVLKMDEGTWTAKMKMWMPGQDDPMDAEGTETNHMMGGFWMVSEFKADIFGQPFEGRGQFGYDEKNDKFVGTWIDTMEPNMTRMQGTWDPDTKTMTFSSTGTDPQTGKTRKGKNVVVYKDNGDRVMTMYMEMEDGELAKSMEIVYTKKK